MAAAEGQLTIGWYGQAAIAGPILLVAQFEDELDYRLVPTLWLHTDYVTATRKVLNFLALKCVTKWRPRLIVTDIPFLIEEPTIPVFVRKDEQTLLVKDIAKRMRAPIMSFIHTEYPWFQFKENQGYRSQEHIRWMLAERGPCEYHRDYAVDNCPLFWANLCLKYPDMPNFLNKSPVWWDEEARGGSFSSRLLRHDPKLLAKVEYSFLVPNAHERASKYWLSHTTAPLITTSPPKRIYRARVRRKRNEQSG